MRRRLRGAHDSIRGPGRLRFEALPTPSLRLHPGQPNAHYYLGRALLAKDQLKAAVGSLRRAVRLAPNDARAHNALAVALAGTKEISAALAELKMARRLKPDNSLFRDNLTCLENRLEGCDLRP